MHAKTRKGVIAALAVATAAIVPSMTASAQDDGDADASGGAGLEAVGLRRGKTLVSFNVEDARSTNPIGDVSGLVGDRGLIGIDYRVQDGELYGVGNNGGIYTLSTNDASATKVGRLTVALDGRRFGVDFNPAANRLRVISNTGQNLRHNIDDPAASTTTTVDGTLTYPPELGTARWVTGAAYTNNDLDPDTSTTLFDLDTMMDQIAVQSPANSGSLAATGKLGVDARGNSGFDIYSTVRDGTTVDLEGYATLSVGGDTKLFDIDLLTGRADSNGKFRKSVTDLAIKLNQR